MQEILSQVLPFCFFSFAYSGTKDVLRAPELESGKRGARSDLASRDLLINPRTTRQTFATLLGRGECHAARQETN